MSSEEEKKLVLARLQTMPSNMKLSLGSHGAVSKEELLDGIKKGSPLGDKFVQIQMAYLRNLAKEYA